MSSDSDSADPELVVIDCHRRAETSSGNVATSRSRKRAHVIDSDSDDEIEIVNPSSVSNDESTSTKGNSNDIINEASDNGERKKTSIAHLHYNYDTSFGTYSCKYCRKTYSKTKYSSTSTLLKHLRSEHSAVISSTEPNKQTTLDNYLKHGRCIDPAQTKAFSKEQFLKALVEHVVLENEPFTLVESSSFKRLLLLCNPEAKAPCAKTIRNEISKLYTIEKNRVKLMLKEAPGAISFVVDGWTSSNQNAFLGIVAQWIDHNWNLNSIVLDLKQLHGSHTGTNLSDAFLEVVQDFDLQGKIYSLTTDNASNMDTFISAVEATLSAQNIDFDKSNNHVRCLAHIVNLCCKDLLDSLSRSTEAQTVASPDSDEELLEISFAQRKQAGVISRLRRCVVKIRASPQRREQFKRQCDAAGMPSRELIRDVDTRWNSTLDMIARAVEVRTPMECVLRAERKLQQFLLTEDEWGILQSAISMLKPFKDITIFLSSEQFPNISFCSIVYSTLYAHLESYTTDPKQNLKGIDPLTGQKYPAWMQEAAAAALAKLSKYYPTSDANTYVIGTVLDPRCKFEWYTKAAKFRPDVIAAYKKNVQAVWKAKYKPINPSVSNNEMSSSNPKLTIFQKSLNALHKAEVKDELEQYLSQKTVPSSQVTTGILTWWKIHEAEFPNLSKMARDCLSAAGAGVLVESMFSNGPDLLSHRRQCMSAEKTSQCFCLKSWIKFRDTGGRLLVNKAIASKFCG